MGKNYRPYLPDQEFLLDDPLLRDDVVFTGRTPPDLSTRHDAYLYGKRHIR
jgi:hypothetical protein